MNSTRQKSPVFQLLFVLLLMSLLTAHFATGGLLTVVYGATASVVVNANNQLCDVSPYIRGQNSCGVYYKTPMTDQNFIDKVKAAGISMMRFPPGAAGQRYDFKYNNYAARDCRYRNNPVSSLEEELTFCNAVGAEPLVQVNTAFVGPNGTSTDATGSLTGGDDYLSYTGVESVDTPANRAKYGADMVTYLHTLCDAKGWEYPVYYGVGNEWSWDSQDYNNLLNIIPLVGPAMKAVDPNIKVSFSCLGISQVGGITDTFDFHSYAYADTDAWHVSPPSLYVYSPGADMDGAFCNLLPAGYNRMKDFFEGYATYFPGKVPVMSLSEWGDHSYMESEMHWAEYMGAIFTAHTLYRAIKHKLLYTCAWSFWTETLSPSDRGCMFTGTAGYPPRPRYFVYQMYYRHFGNKLVECYDPAEYTPGVTEFFNEYKDDHDSLLVQASKRSDGNVAIMAINLNDTTSYATQIAVNGLNMSGNVDVYVLDSTNSYEGGPGPSSSTLTGKSSPFGYTFPAFTVTCLVVKGTIDTTPPANITAVRDGTAADAASTSLTTQLSANWDASSDPENGIAKYWYAIGTSPGSTDVVGWTPTGNGTDTSVTKTGLALTVGQKYYFSIKAENGVGLQSTPANSNGQTVGGGTTDTLTVWPNPYSLSRPGGMKFVINGQAGGEVKIYTMAGKLVREVRGESGAGEINWDGTNEDGEKVARGIYIYIITDETGSKTGNIAVVR